MTFFKNLLSFSFVLIGLILNAQQIEAAAVDALNAKLDPNGEQMKLVSLYAPYFVLPKARLSDGTDNVLPFNFLNANSYDVSKNDLGKVENISALKKFINQTTIYFDYFETKDAIVITYMPYRAIDRGRNFLESKRNDTEYVSVVLKKEKSGSSFEEPMQNLKPQFVILLASAGAESIKTAINLDRTRHLGTLTDRALGGLKVFSDMVGDYDKGIFETRESEPTRAIILSLPTNHLLAPTFSLKTTVNNYNLAETYTLAAKDSEAAKKRIQDTNVAATEEQDKVYRTSLDEFHKTRLGIYDLVELAPLVLDEKIGTEMIPTLPESTQDVRGGIAPRAEFAGDMNCKDINGKVICQRKMGGNLKAETPKTQPEGNLPYASRITLVNRPDLKVRGNGSQRRDMAHIDRWLLEGFKDLVTDDGALMVRNPYYQYGTYAQ